MGGHQADTRVYGGSSRDRKTTKRGNSTCQKLEAVGDCRCTDRCRDCGSGELHVERTRRRRMHQGARPYSSTFTTTNCTSPVGLCTEGKITGAGPLDSATTFSRSTSILPPVCPPSSRRRTSLLRRPHDQRAARHPRDARSRRHRRRDDVVHRARAPGVRYGSVQAREQRVLHLRRHREQRDGLRRRSLRRAALARQRLTRLQSCAAAYAGGGLELRRKPPSAR